MTVWNGGKRQATVASPESESSVISRFPPYAARPSGNARREHWEMDSLLLSIDTAGRTVIDLTDDVRRFCRDHGDGLVNVFAPHATAGIALMEVGSGSEADLEDALAASPSSRGSLCPSPRGGRPRGRPCTTGVRQPVADRPRPRGPPATRHLAEHGPGRHQQRQSPPPGPAELRSRMKSLRCGSRACGLSGIPWRSSVFSQ